MDLTLVEHDDAAIPIALVSAEGFPAWLKEQTGSIGKWLESIGFTGKAGTTALVPGPDGRLGQVVHGVDPTQPIWAVAGLPGQLPAGVYAIRFDGGAFGSESASALALGWMLGSYAFTRYKPTDHNFACMIWPASADRAEVTALAEGFALARDLINTPAEEMGPAELAAAASDLAGRHGAEVSLTVGDDLLAAGYPLIHAVGRGSARAPRLIDIRWGDPDARKLTLVGKGVCFDSGGLDLKTATGMKLMKKDMGGAATLLGLAHAIMALKLPVRLRVLVPAVENFVSSTAFRPMDVFRTRKGLTVEIGNTDAEGRLVLGDALTEASSEQPELIIDMATLTGAARTALGPELPALFSNDDDVADKLLAAARAEHDPLWRMPLWQPYRKMLDSKIATINNASDSGYAGAITAALYLQEFVEPDLPWIHIDTFAWNATSRPGRPEGGEALGLRALYRLLKDRFAG